MGVLTLDGGATWSLDNAIRGLNHRGPDAQGRWNDDAVALGHTRLQIIDLTDAGAQPMVSRDGTVVMSYNGEIYNYRDLANRHAIQARNDTRLFVELWARSGPGCLSELNGMFAAAIWDRRSRALFLVRDRLGVKPLYYAVRQGLVAFASEARVLADLINDRAVRPEAAEDVLIFGSVLGPKTWYRSVDSVLPASYVKFGNRSREHIRWWSPTSQPFSQEAFEAVFQDAVSTRLISDVPLGVFVSSGLDSQSILAAASRTTKSLTGFTVSFQSDGIAANESAEARSFCDRLGVHHEAVDVSDESGGRYTMEWLKSQDQPSIDGLNAFTISKLAKPFVTVALAGLGGDEFLAGYSTFKWARLLAALRRRRNRVPDMRSNASWDRGRMDALWDLWSSTSDPLTDYLGIKLVAPLGLVDPGSASGFVARAREVREGLPNSYSGLAEVAALEATIYMQNMLLRDADNMSMRNSLEVRYPFLDYRLVEMLLGPQMEGFISKRNGTKVPLRRYARRVGVKASNHKRGFTVPLGRWSRQPAVSEMLDDAFRSDTVGFHVYGRKRMYELREMAHGSEFPTYRSLWQMWAVAVVSAHLRPAS